MRHLPPLVLVGLGLVGLLGNTSCATSFQGSADISPAECSSECRRVGGELAAYVFMGRYSTACVCTPPGATASAETVDVAASTGGAVAGVWMQMQSASARR